MAYNGRMRYLAIDPGQKRTGLAVGDDQTDIASPLEPIVTSSDTQRWAALAQAIDQQGPDALILGFPLNMDGTEGEPARRARAWAGQLSERFGLPVHLVDERLTSAAADDLLAGRGLTHGQKRRRRDSLAAVTMLKDFLQSLEA